MPVPRCLESTDNQTRSECYEGIAKKVAEVLLRDLERYRANVKHTGTYKVPYFAIQTILDELGIELCPPITRCPAKFGAVIYHLMKILSGMGFDAKKHEKSRALVIRERHAVHPTPVGGVVHEVA
jgi:hypothetical protein